MQYSNISGFTHFNFNIPIDIKTSALSASLKSVSNPESTQTHSDLVKVKRSDACGFKKKNMFVFVFNKAEVQKVFCKWLAGVSRGQGGMNSGQEALKIKKPLKGSRSP